MNNNKRKRHFLPEFMCAMRAGWPMVFAALAMGGQAWAQTTPASSNDARPVAPVAAAELSPLTRFEPSAPQVQAPAADAPLSAVGSPEGCRILTDRAMAADLRAATAQSQKAESAQLGRLLDESIGLWTLATERCTDRGQDRARRNLADSQRTRQALNAELGAGPECAIRQKDANSLQDLAQQAVKERRWLDASVMYRKAENMWDVAAERCTGDPQRMALQRRDQTATDAHNAEFCAPHFERAREATQALGRQGDPADKTVRQAQSQVAETLWRDAMAQCKGAPMDIARNNAQRLAKERGTAWVPTNAPEPVTKPTLGPGVAGAPAAGPLAMVQPTVPAAALSEPVPGANPGVQTSAPRAPEATTQATGPQDTDLRSGDTHFQGRFVRRDGLFSGTGRVSWANGDVYNGALVDNKRHGQGEFVWANGQRFRGDWVQDVPHGKGSMKFATGNQYDGDIAQGEPHGEGHMVFASGDSFQGRFVKGKPEGEGTYRWTSGQTYEGPWSRDSPNGTGKLAYANGNRYEGPLVQGVPDGLGRLAFASGDEYRGQFSHGAPHGEGTYSWKAGDRYVGQWQAGQKHGQGRFEWANGDRWEGLFQNDTQTDKGTLTRKTP